MSYKNKLKVESILSEQFIRWDEVEEGKGYIKCPAAHLHNRPTQDSHTVVYVNGVATIYCVHQSCAKEIEKCNKVLRRQLNRDGDWSPKKMTEEQKDTFFKKCKYEKEAKRLEKHRGYILDKYKWTTDEMVEARNIITSPFNDWLDLWPNNPEGSIWMGDTYHTGDKCYAKNFKHPGHWFNKIEHEDKPIPYPFTCGSLFEEGTFNRAQKSVVQRVFTIIECDELSADPTKNMNLTGSVFKWLQEERGWKLRCVISSGNKSCHGWFDYVPEDEEWAKKVLPSLGVDAATLRPAQAVRAPEFVREDGKGVQQVLWI